MSETEIEKTARRYIAVYGAMAWLVASLIADRYCLNGDQKRFRDWKMVANQIDRLSPQV
jgi:hypothetical protein